MKKFIYITSLIAFSAVASNAQIAAGVIASSVVSKAIVAQDVDLKTSFANNTGEISWNAAQLIKVRRYELEKSMDGENFSYIAAVAGTNNHYSIEDRNLLENTNYYRIKIVDIDGNYFYSSTAVLDIRNSFNEIKILPTQINQKLFVWLPVNTSISKAIISDASGRMISPNSSINNTTNLAAIETTNLPAGMYNLNLQTNKGEIIKLRFNKQPS